MSLGFEEKGFEYKIVLVQPGITKGALQPKVGEMLAAAKSHIAACANASLGVMASA